MSRTRVLVTTGLVLILLFSFGCTFLNTDIVEHEVDAETYAVSSDSPSFNYPDGNTSHDYIRTLDPPIIQIKIRVEVLDPDGVDSVIGSWANAHDSYDHEFSWVNVTMSHAPIEVYPDLYTAWVLNYTYGVDDWGHFWYFKAYANDTLGHWSVSEVWYSSFAVIGRPHPDYELIFGYILLFALPVIIIGICYGLEQRTKRPIVWIGKSKK